MKIGNKEIGKDHSVFIIAELSANHNGSLNTAFDTIKAAKRAGADGIKLQTYTADTITIDSRKDDFLIKGTIWEGKNLYDLYKEAYTPWEWHPALFEAAKAEGLICFSSPFDQTAVDFLEELDTPAYKIASFEITDIPLIEYVASKGKPIIISTGIAETLDIELALDACHSKGNHDIALLKCTSSYPAPIEEANMVMVKDLAERYGVISGLSDHTIGSMVPVVATCFGAKIIEKHFILDHAIGGPDASFSMDEKEFTEMVKAVREAEKAMGKVDYRLTDKQEKGKDFSRSLYVVEDIEAGELITQENVRSIRPGFGLHPKHYYGILGSRVNRDLEKGEPLKLEYLHYHSLESKCPLPYPPQQNRFLLSTTERSFKSQHALPTTEVQESKYLNGLKKLLEWEEKYPVGDWKVGDMPLWPILKMVIFYHVRNQLYLNKRGMAGAKPTLFLRLRSKIARLFSKALSVPMARFHMRKLKLKKTDFLFAGTFNHRINWKGQSYNRYFDPILDYLAEKGENGYLLEYQQLDTSDVFKKNRVIDLTKVLPFFAGKAYHKEILKGLVGLDALLKEVNDNFELKEAIVKQRLMLRINGISHWARLFDYMIAQTHAKYAFGLCYYAEAMYGMNLAAHRRGITSIDMQHGGQGPMHFAYHFKNIPAEGYALLPRQFWLWDKGCYNNIDAWTKNTMHQPILGGNPWIAILDKVEDKVHDGAQPMILYTLQLTTPLIEEHFLKLISATAQEYSWWLRLHPRTTAQQIDELNRQLAAFALDKKVEIEKASTLPLPLLLKKSSLHISGNSGAIAEAAMVGTMSLIIDEIGVYYYQGLIKSQDAIACLAKDPNVVAEVIKEVIKASSSQKDKSLTVPVGFEEIIESFRREHKG